MNNSETVTDIINFILTSSAVVREPRVYTNQITFAFADQLKVAHDAAFFPDMRLHVFRLTPEYVQTHRQQLNQLFQQTTTKDADYEVVWMTSSHLVDRHLRLVEFSFE